MERIYVPQLLDTKERFLIFYLYEIVAFVSVLFGFYLMGVAPVGILGSFLSLFVCRHLRVKGYISQIVPTLYWYFPAIVTKTILKTEDTPPSSMRVYTGG